MSNITLPLTSDKEKRDSDWLAFIAALSFVLLLSIYTLARYRGLWGESDSSAFSIMTQGILANGTLLPSQQGISIYPHGYGYQSLLVFLVHLTGVPLTQWQIIWSVLLITWMVFPAWLCYRELIQSSWGATLCTLVIFTQPEFLFVILRATHEKFTRGLLFFILYLFVRSLRSRYNVNQFASWIVVFYLAVYAVVTFNNLIASSFLSTFGITLGLYWIITRFFSNVVPGVQNKATLQRLVYIITISIGIIFLFSFYAYKPAQADLVISKSVWDGLVSLFINDERSFVEADVTITYGSVNSTWVSLPVYLTISSANWFLLLGSALIWMRQSLYWLWQRRWPDDTTQKLLWSLYGALAFLGFVTVVMDISGIVARNFQHRFFPSFAMIAAPVVVNQLLLWRHKIPFGRSVAYALIAIMMTLFALLSTFKATNEPLVSNKWVFYVPAEKQAQLWAQDKLAHRIVWQGFDERLRSGLYLQTNDGSRQDFIDVYWENSQTRNFLVSDVTRSRSWRYEQPLPIKSNDFITFDNGVVQIYHRRPLTNYQK